MSESTPNLKRGQLVTYGGREWIVVALDAELDQVRIRRRIWDRASGTSRTIYAYAAPSRVTPRPQERPA